MRAILIFLAAILLVYKTNAQFCGRQHFNPTFSLCCYGHVRSRGISNECCGTESYNPNFKQCCYGAILSRNIIKTHCCGREQYDPTFNICCFGTVYSKARVSNCANYGNFGSYNGPYNNGFHFQNGYMPANPFLNYQRIGK